MSYLPESLEVPLPVAHGNDLGVERRRSDRCFGTHSERYWRAAVPEVKELPPDPAADVTEARGAQGVGGVLKPQVKEGNLEPQIDIGM